MMTMSVGDLLDDWFENDALKGAYASTGVVGVWAGPRTPGTAYNLLHHELGELDGVGGAWGHVRGGMGAISEAIAAQRAGVRRGRPDRRRRSPRSTSRGGRVHGVTLDDGETITRARSCSPARTRRRPCSTSSAASTSRTRSSRTCAATARAAGR